ncbi:MAG TPA: ATP-binding cassette domain-containing protein, partial [Thermoleophilia bacterium]|nr:ATP-binding cassette domain-containing protein [Thermoleophilia bacterium]
MASPTSSAGAGTVPSVSVRNLAKSFGSVRAVQDVSFDVYPGEIFGLLGPNGSGKTTTIRMMLDIFEPDTGTVQVLGGTLDQARKDRVGYLPEDRGLYKDQKLDTVLTYLGRLKGLDGPTVAERLESWLRRLDLLEHREKKVQELSKGMQQKAQVIATLLHDPDLIVVDEPFSGLDPVNTRIIEEVFDEQRAAGKSIIMSTHQMYQVEALCSRIALINQGEVVLYGEVEEIRRRFAGNAVVVQGEGSFADLAGVVDARLPAPRSRRCHPARLRRVRSGQGSRPRAPPGCAGFRADRRPGPAPGAIPHWFAARRPRRTDRRSCLS